jgi:hypothetical protein
MYLGRVRTWLDADLADSLSAIPSFELTKNLWITPAPLIRRAAAPPTLVGTGFRLLAAVLRK